jgi:hypothetical protein
MVNYGKGKIYKIQKIGGNSEIYIGSTTKDYLSQRMDKHRSGYRNWAIGTKGLTSYKIFDLYGVENCEIVLLESVNCNTKDELHARERFHIENNVCVNIRVPMRKLPANYHQMYQLNNKEKIKARRKQHYETNKEQYLERVNKYRINNMDIIKEKKKLYTNTNKEKIKLKRAETYICECGCETTIVHKNRHVKTAKHIKLMETLNTK